MFSSRERKRRGGGSTQTLNTPSISHPDKCRHSPFKSEWKPPLLPSPPGISPLYLFPFVSNAFVNSSTKVKANNPLQTLGVTATSMNPSQLSSPAAQCLSRLLSFTTVSTKGWSPTTRWVNTTTVTLRRRKCCSPALLLQQTCRIIQLDRQVLA